LKVARDLIYDRREFDGEVCIYDPLTKFTTLFENVKAKSARKASKANSRRAAQITLLMAKKRP